MAFWPVSLSLDNTAPVVSYGIPYSHRFTASFIELLLSETNVSPHRALTKFVRHVTKFTLTDATDLEFEEPPLSPNLFGKIESYGKIVSADRLLTIKNGRRYSSFIGIFIDRIVNSVIGTTAARYCDAVGSRK